MRLEEVKERGKFKFITNDGESLYFFGQLFIFNGGKGEIFLSVDDVSLLPYTLNDEGIFSLIGQFNTLNNCIFTGCFISSQPRRGSGEIKITFNNALLKLDDKVFNTQVKLLHNKLNIKPNGIQIYINNLDLWAIGFDVFDIIDENNMISLTCNMRNDVVLYQDEFVIISILFAYDYSIFPEVEGARISEHPYIEINKKEGAFNNVDELWDYLHKITSLISILLGEEAYINSINAIFIENGHRCYSPFIFEMDLVKTNQALLGWHDINFSLNDVIRINKEVDVFSTWMTRFDEISPSIELYRTYKKVNNKYSEINFLWMAQIIEALHRRISDRKEYAVADYEKMCNKLRECCPKEYLTWLEPRLKYGNEISFKSRLSEFMDDTKNTLNNQPYDDYSMKLDFSDKEFGKFVSDIVRYRNYYTHYDPSMKKTNTQRAKKLIALRSLLELILLIQIFKFIGLTDKNLGIILLKWQNRMGKLLRKTKFLLKKYYK